MKSDSAPLGVTALGDSASHFCFFCSSVALPGAHFLLGVDFEGVVSNATETEFGESCVGSVGAVPGVDMAVGEGVGTNSAVGGVGLGMAVGLVKLWTGVGMGLLVVASGARAVVGSVMVAGSGVFMADDGGLGGAELSKLIRRRRVGRRRVVMGAWLVRFSTTRNATRIWLAFTSSIMGSASLMARCALIVAMSSA